MANPVSATQVGSYFVQQYYQVFQHQQDRVHQFYDESSTMLRIDGDKQQSCDEMLQIHQTIMSLNFTGIEIKTINSFDSWRGGLIVGVTGSVKSKDFSGWRKFVQTFFLAPQEKGYFVLNDMFHFADVELAHQLPVPVAEERYVDYQPSIPAHIPDPAVSDYPLENAAGGYGNSIRAEVDEPVLEYSYQDHPREPETVLEPEPEETPFEDEPPFEEETHFEDSTPSAWIQSTTATVAQEHQPFVEEPFKEPEKLTYASILRAKVKSRPATSYQTAYTQNTSSTGDWNHEPQSSTGDWNHVPQSSTGDWNHVPQSSTGDWNHEPQSSTGDWNHEPQSSTGDWNHVPQSSTGDWNHVSQSSTTDWNHVSQSSQQQSTPTLPNSFVETFEEALSLEEGESLSVYVRNLPSTVTSLDIQQEFENFGKIKHDGVFLKNRQDTGVCFAFVEFEDVQSVQNAIKASPIQFSGKQVYIEERRPNTGASRGRGRGGMRGRGRGRSYGRGNEQNGSDNSSRYRSNNTGFRTY